MRRKEWKQANPKDQLVAVLAAAAGFVSNISAGVYSKKNLSAKLTSVENLLEQAVELTDMVDGRWPKKQIDAKQKLDSLAKALKRKNISSIPGALEMLIVKNFFISFVNKWYIVEHRWTGNRKQFKRQRDVVFFIERHSL